MLTYEELRRRLEYDRTTGVFTWIVPSNKSTAGEVAGWINNRGYWVIGIGYERFLAHRLAFLYMTRRWPKDGVDHINGKCDDNRWENLRPATQSQNLCNQKAAGYYHNGWSWYAYINVNKKRKWFGPFREKSDAIDARAQARRDYQGDYAYKE